MAYDPEARQTSNTAMVIGIVALVVVVLGALAYWATRGNEPATQVVTTPGPTQVIHENNTVAVPVPVPGNTTVVTQPVPVPGTTTKAPTTTTHTDVHVTVPATSGAPRTAPASGSPSVTINNNNRPTAGSATTTTPPAGDAATSNSASSATTSNSTSSGAGGTRSGTQGY